jgi:phosphoglycerate dehydrogenase-like enzyme
MINHARLALMKHEAYLINVARAGLVVAEDLVDALKKKRIAGAALDVTDPEPPLETDPLLSMDNVIFSAHQGGNTKECWNRMCHVPRGGG